MTTRLRVRSSNDGRSDGYAIAGDPHWPQAGFNGPTWHGKFSNRSRRTFGRYTVYYAITQM